MELPKYSRYGYIDQGRHCDKLLSTFVEQVPGDGHLPSRWRYYDNAQFVHSYGHLGVVLWAASYNSHLLLVGGTKVIRIWTDAKAHCWVEGVDHVMSEVAPLEQVPAKNARKSKPFVVRKKITDPTDISALAKRVNMIYGI